MGFFGFECKIIDINMTHKQIIIIGGGPVGLTMALELAQQNKKVTVIDLGLSKKEDGRVLALSYASYLIYNNLDVWPDQNKTTAINCVQISHNGLGVSRIKANSLDLPALGFTVKYADLCVSLEDKVLHNPNIQLIIGKVTKIDDLDQYSVVNWDDELGDKQLLTADLVIMAEGGKLLANKSKQIDHDYEQQALILRIKTKEKHNNLAHERFGGSGPLVLLPFQDEYVVVWSLADDVVNGYMQNHEKMINQLDNEFTSRLGGAKLIGTPVSFPLRLIKVKQRVLKRTILIGNSAQVVHPVSAQGLNLGLRDVALLSNILSKSNQIDPETFADYHKLREKDVSAVVHFTHLLATRLESGNQIFNHLRGVGLIALSNLPSVQDFMARSLIFGL